MKNKINTIAFIFALLSAILETIVAGICLLISSIIMSFFDLLKFLVNFLGKGVKKLFFA